jgi:methyl-accepting chemotaxis protein
LYGFYYFKYKAGGISLTRFIVEMGNYSTSSRGMYMTDRFELIIIPMAITFLAFILLSFIFGIVYSHKLAGPVYRLEKSLIQIIEGERDFEVRLRKGDQFKKFEILLNKLLKKLGDETSEINEFSREIMGVYDELIKLKESKHMSTAHLEKVIDSLEIVSKKLKMYTM